MYDILELQKMKVLDLRNIAKGLDIKRIEKFKKQDLIYEILDQAAIKGAKSSSESKNIESKTNIKHSDKQVKSRPKSLNSVSEKKPKIERKQSDNKNVPGQTKINKPKQKQEPVSSEKKVPSVNSNFFKEAYLSFIPITLVVILFSLNDTNIILLI